MVEQSGQEWAGQCVQGAQSVQAVVPSESPPQQQPDPANPAKQYSNPKKTKTAPVTHAKPAVAQPAVVQPAVVQPAVVQPAVVQHAANAPPSTPPKAPKSDPKDSFVFAVPNRKPPVMVDWKNTFNVRHMLVRALRNRETVESGAAPGSGAATGVAAAGARRNGMRPGVNGMAPRDGPREGPRDGPREGAPTAGSGYGAARSLDLLRVNLQPTINKDIKQVLNKYLERFFKPAVQNIRMNLGQGHGQGHGQGCEAVGEHDIRVVLQRVLEEAKLMYATRPSVPATPNPVISVPRPVPRPGTGERPAPAVAAAATSTVPAPRRHRKRNRVAVTATAPKPSTPTACSAAASPVAASFAAAATPTPACASALPALPAATSTSTASASGVVSSSTAVAAPAARGVTAVKGAPVVKPSGAQGQRPAPALAVVGTVAASTSPAAPVVKLTNGVLGHLVGPLHPLSSEPPPATLQQMFKKRKELDAELEAKRKRARLSGLQVDGSIAVVSASAAAPAPTAASTPAAAPAPAARPSPRASPRPSPSPSPSSTSSTGPAPRRQDAAPAATPAASTVVAPVVTPVAAPVVTPVAAPAAAPAASLVAAVAPDPASASATSSSNVNHASAKWDPNRITPDTLFVMGARANKVLGYETSRGRLYTKHQDLFKYASDQEDKEWLSKNHLIQPTGGKAFLCILQDIQELAVSQEYKNSPNVNLLELKGFRAPDFLLKKIRAYMTNLRAEPLDDLSGLLEMELLQDDGVASMDDSSLMELMALEYGVNLMGDDTSPVVSSTDVGRASSPTSTTASRPSPPRTSTTAMSPTAMLTTLPPSLEALAPLPGSSADSSSARGAAARTPADAVATTAGTVAATSSTPVSPVAPVERAKSLIRSQSLPTPGPFVMEPLALDDLEMYIKSTSVEDGHFEHIMSGSPVAVDVGDSDAGVSVPEPGGLDVSLDASLEANLDASLDLNLDVNLDVSGAEHHQLELAWDLIGDLSTPPHSPAGLHRGRGDAVGVDHDDGLDDDYRAEESSSEDADAVLGAPVGVTVAAAASLPTVSTGTSETSLAVSHATLTALLAGNTLDSLEIPDRLL